MREFMKKPITWLAVFAVILTAALILPQLIPAPEDPVETQPNQQLSGKVEGQDLADTNTNSGVSAVDVTDNIENEDDVDLGDSNIDTAPAYIGKPLSWEMINSFPIKTSDMSIENRRKLCVNFFRYAKTALWIPDESIDYIRNSKGSRDYMTGDSVYGGLPYVGSSHGTIYRLMDYINEKTGVVDMSDMLNLTGGVLETKALAYFGNQCANGCYVGWSRVVNSVSAFTTATMTKHYGYIPLGDYPTSVQKWDDKTGYHTYDAMGKSSASETATENPTAAADMYEDYALLQIGDGLVYYTTAGHVIMASSDAHVERLSDGTIDGDNSYIYVVHQAQSWEEHTADDGTKYQIKDSVDTKLSFAKLFNSNYVPFTFEEFQEEDVLEETTVSLTLEGSELTSSTITASQLFSSSVEASYAVTDVYIVITDDAGQEVYRHAVRYKDNYWGKTVPLVKTGVNVDSWGSWEDLTAQSYNVEIIAQLGTGERPTVYLGALVLN